MPSTDLNIFTQDLPLDETKHLDNSMMDMERDGDPESLVLTSKKAK